MDNTQIAFASGNSVIVQINSNGTSPVPGQPHLALIKPWKVEPASRDELWPLQAEAFTGDLVGRQAQRELLRTWLGMEAKISIEVLCGQAGQGKTRLAMELCREYEQQGWLTGFVSPRELTRFVEQQNLAHWGWQGPTLAVVDYVLEGLDSLETWVEELAQHQIQTEHPLRLLLLERQAQREAGWLKDLFPGGLGRGMREAALLAPDAPLELTGLSERQDRLAVLRAMLEELGAGQLLATAQLDDLFRANLDKTRWADNPLFLLMAAMLMAEGNSKVLRLNKWELAKAFADKEINRSGRVAQRANVSKEFLRHLVAYVVLCGGLESRGKALDIIREEQAHLGLDSQHADKMHEALRKVLPRRAKGLDPIKPDALGEALVLEILRRAGADEAGSAISLIRRAFAQTGRMVPLFISRCGMDYPQDSPAPSWLEALAEDAWDAPDQLVAIVHAMPDQSLIFGSSGKRRGSLV